MLLYELIIVAGGHLGFCTILQNAQPTTNCVKWILKVNYLSISKQQKKFGVAEMQGSGTGNPTKMCDFRSGCILKKFDSIKFKMAAYRPLFTFTWPIFGKPC